MEAQRLAVASPPFQQNLETWWHWTLSSTRVSLTRRLWASLKWRVNTAARKKRSSFLSWRYLIVPSNCAVILSVENYVFAFLVVSWLNLGGHWNYAGGEEQEQAREERLHDSPALQVLHGRSKVHCIPGLNSIVMSKRVPFPLAPFLCDFSLSIFPSSTRLWTTITGRTWSLPQWRSGRCCTQPAQSRKASVSPSRTNAWAESERYWFAVMEHQLSTF